MPKPSLGYPYLPLALHMKLFWVFEKRAKNDQGNPDCVPEITTFLSTLSIVHGREAAR
jgi:hypothetical protein